MILYFQIAAYLILIYSSNNSNSYFASFFRILILKIVFHLRDSYIAFTFYRKNSMQILNKKKYRNVKTIHPSNKIIFTDKQKRNLTRLNARSYAQSYVYPPSS